SSNAFCMFLRLCRLMWGRSVAFQEAISAGWIADILSASMRSTLCLGPTLLKSRTVVRASRSGGQDEHPSVAAPLGTPHVSTPTQSLSAHRAAKLRIKYL